MYSFKHNIPIISNLSKVDLKPYYCGTEDCDRGHSWGPAIKDHYKIHYVHSGKGFLKIAEKTYFVRAGQCFLIGPDKVSFYKADEEDPWTYYWIAFSGLNTVPYLNRAGFSNDTPIITLNKDQEILDCFHQMFEHTFNQKCGDLLLLSSLYNFLSILIAENQSNESSPKNQKIDNTYISKAIELFEMNYSSTISIAGIADSLGINRKYFSRLFKEATGDSPIEFLVKFRLNKACQLMENKTLNIGEISRSVGYADQLLFSKTFKKFKGMSPSEYRNLSEHFS